MWYSCLRVIFTGFCVTSDNTIYLYKTISKNIICVIILHASNLSYFCYNLSLYLLSTLIDRPSIRSRTKYLIKQRIILKHLLTSIYFSWYLQQLLSPIKSRLSQLLHCYYSAQRTTFRCRQLFAGPRWFSRDYGLERRRFAAATNIGSTRWQHTFPFAGTIMAAGKPISALQETIAGKMTATSPTLWSILNCFKTTVILFCYRQSQ